MNSEFVPRLQFISGIISLLNSILLLFVGGAFLFFPLWVLSVLLDYSSSSQQYFDRLLQDEKIPVDESVITLSRMVGCVLLGQGISCIVLLSILSEWVCSINNCHNYSRLAVWNVRTSVTIQIVTGLLWIVVSLFDDRGNEVAGTYRRNTFGLLLIGFVIFILGCFGMMLSFFPAIETSDGTVERERIRGEDQGSSHESNDLVEPLLPRDHEDQNIPDSVPSLVEGENDDDELEVGPHHDNTVENENNPEPTSRIRGTQRLLAIAKPEVIYLYIGCITLLIRLPFSLAIPHFVSTTLGALSHAEYDRARREIIWLFILGTIDALLDFWCIFWFQFANHRIVRGVRIDTFLSMLRQDIGFFDSRTSGDLSSRLNSDCGEMAGDLVSCELTFLRLIMLYIFP